MRYVQRAVFAVAGMMFLSGRLLATVETPAAGRAAPFRFAVFGDSEVMDSPAYASPSEARTVFTGILGELGAHKPKPAFLLILGDLVEGHAGHSRDCAPEVYDRQFGVFRNVLKQHLDPSIAFYPCVGNHDYHRYRGGTVDSGPEKYAQHIHPLIPEGVQPRKSSYYSFDHGNAHFVVLCTGLLGARWVDDYKDLVYGKQYEWLARDLAAARGRAGVRHIFVFGHHPFYPLVNDFDSWPEGQKPMQERIWRGLFVKYGVKAYFHGHDQFYDRSVHEGIAMIDVGGAGGLENPGHSELRVNHYAIVEVEGARVRVNIHLPGRKLYESYELADLQAGKLAPPEVALKGRLSQLASLFPLGLPTGVAERDPSTVLLHHFDEVKDNHFRDAAKGHSMALRSGVTVVPGKFGQACRFRGEKACLSAPVRDFPGARGLISMWVAFDRIEGEQMLCRVQSPKDGLKLMMRVREDRPEIHFYVYSRSNKKWYRIRTDIGSWKPDEWHHVGACWDADALAMQIFLDGRMAVNGSLGFKPDFGSATVWVGADSDLMDRLDGAVDELTIKRLGP